MRSMSDEERKVVTTLVESVTLLIGMLDTTLPHEALAPVNWRSVRTMLFDAADEAGMINMDMPFPAVLPEKE